MGWTDYNNGLTSFLHNTNNIQVNAGHLRTTTKVWGQNVWSWDLDTLYKLIVKPTELKYQFDFYQQCPATGAATCTQGGQPGDYRWASITPIFTQINLPADAILNRLNLPFTMRPVTDCNMCADQQHTIKQLEYTVTDADVATGHFNCAQSSGQQDYDNWVASLRRTVGSDVSLLQRCIPTAEGLADCDGDTNSNVGAFSWGD